jgi:hypothetical protein
MSENSDPEKNLDLKEPGGSDSPASPERAEYEDGPKLPWTRRFVDSFKRDPNASVTKTEASAVSRGRFDHKTAAENTANSGLVQKLQSRHMQMIAIGGSIGTSFALLFSYYIFILRPIASSRMVLYNIITYAEILTRPRYWSLRHIWQGSRHGRSCLSGYCILHHRYPHVLHGAGSR